MDAHCSVRIQESHETIKASSGSPKTMQVLGSRLARMEPMAHAANDIVSDR